MPATGPDFISLQRATSTLRRRSTSRYLGLVRSQTCRPPHAVVFETKPIAFALRDVVPGTDLASVAQPWYWRPRSGSTPPTSRPFTMLWSPTVTPSSPHLSTALFGRTFTFADPYGYQVTLHDRA